MPVSSSAFELCLVGSSEPHQFTAYVPGPDGARAAEHTFAWRIDSTALALDLGALARAAVSGQPPENDLHVSFGQRLFDAVLGGAVGELWEARRAASTWEPLSRTYGPWIRAQTRIERHWLPSLATPSHCSLHRRLIWPPLPQPLRTISSSSPTPERNAPAPSVLPSR